MNIDQSPYLRSTVALLSALAVGIQPAVLPAQQGPLGGREVDLGGLEEIYVRELPKGPWSPGLPKTAPNLEEDSKVDPKLLQGFKRYDNKRTFDPVFVAGQVNAIAAMFDNECKFVESSCVRAKTLRGIAQSLLAANKANPGCGDAANSFSKYYHDANPPPEVAKKFDLACLSAFALRKLKENTIEPQPAIPAIMTRGGSDSAVQGALGAVAILAVNGVPFCGGLLRRDRTIMTAGHCFHEARNAFESGLVTARSADGRILPIKVLTLGSRMPTFASTKAADDWAVFRLGGSGTLEVPDTSLAEATIGGEVTLVGHFAHFKSVTYASPAQEDWAQGLRMPRQGFCQILDLPPNCVQVACQTVRGFSGTPVFQLQPAVSGTPLTVIGFVSSSNSLDAKCPSRIPGHTALVSARQFSSTGD
jgi:Trypsin-like peptidase domain